MASLDKIVADFTYEEGVASLEKALADLEKEINGPDVEVKLPKGSWPFGPSNEGETVEESTSKWFTVRTYYKKSCEQHEHFYNSKGGAIIVKDGFRSAEFRV